MNFKRPMTQANSNKSNVRPFTFHASPGPLRSLSPLLEKICPSASTIRRSVHCRFRLCFELCFPSFQPHRLRTGNALMIDGTASLPRLSLGSANRTVSAIPASKLPGLSPRLKSDSRTNQDTGNHSFLSQERSTCPHSLFMHMPVQTYQRTLTLSNCHVYRRCSSCFQG